MPVPNHSTKKQPGRRQWFTRRNKLRNGQGSLVQDQAPNAGERKFLERKSLLPEVAPPTAVDPQEEPQGEDPPEEPKAQGFWGKLFRRPTT